MWKTLSQPSETLSLDQFHTQQYDPHRVLQSITGKWIGLDGKCFGSLAVIFSAEGLPIYVAFYEDIIIQPREADIARYREKLSQSMRSLQGKPVRQPVVFSGVTLLTQLTTELPCGDV